MANGPVDFYARTRSDATTLSDRLIIAGCDVDRYTGMTSEPYPFRVQANGRAAGLDIEALIPEVTEGLDVVAKVNPNVGTF